MALRTPPADCEFFAGTRRHQSYILEFAPANFSAEQCDFLAAELARQGCVDEAATHATGEPALRFFELVAQTHCALLRGAGLFYPEGAELIHFDPEEPRFRMAVPRAHRHDRLALTLFARLINACARSARQKLPVEPWLGQMRGNLSKRSHPGPNMALFVRAAFELGMPVVEWQSGQLQIGYGANATVLNGSITDRTPSNGIYIAREKALCNALLAQAGFPVANGALVKDLAGAKKAATAIGYPVVVKPADLDGGLAVSADIRTEEELEAAYNRAREASPNIQVESHIEGRDYRLLLFHGRLLTAIERTPGGVTGNGRDTVGKLLEDLNAAPNRGPGHDTLLYPVELDDEARRMLQQRGMTLESIPEDGAFIRLRKAANFALGGSIRVVDDEVHPDNLDLARRSARLLRLDLAGLDLLMPDIARSWRETGGAICEINAQPFIGEPVRKDFHKIILEELAGKGGRIPIVLVIGTLTPEMLSGLARKLPGLATADAGGAWRDGHPLSRAGATWEQACQAPLFDPQVEALLCILDPGAKLPLYSPADRYSAAFLLDPGATEGGAIAGEIAALLRRSDRIVVTGAGHRSMLAPIGLEGEVIDRKDLPGKLKAALSGK